jgi:hypothetical protein
MCRFKKVFALLLSLFLLVSYVPVAAAQGEGAVQAPQQVAPLKVVEVTPAPGSEIDPDAEIRVRFDRPVEFPTGCESAYNLNGSGMSFHRAPGTDPADPCVVRLEKPCGFPAGQITLPGVRAHTIWGRDDGARLAEDMPPLTYTVRAKAPAAARFAPEQGARVNLHLVSTIGGGYYGYARPDQIQPAVDFDVPVEVADPAKVQMVVRTPLYERTWTVKTDPAGQGNFLINSVGQRIALQENYHSLSVLGPAFQGTLTLRFLPGAIRHHGSSGQDGLNTDTIELTVQVNPPAADNAYVPGSPPPAVEAKVLNDPKVAWEAVLPSSDGRVRGVARIAGGVVVSNASGMAAYNEMTGNVLWQVDGYFSAPAVGPDGGVYVAKGVDTASGTDFYLERYNPDGTLSWSRYLPGELTVPGDWVPKPPVVLPDGDLLIAVGDSAFGLGSGTGLVIWRFGPDGSLKGAWDLTEELGGNATWANASSKLVAHGYKAVVATGYNIAVVDFSGTDPVVLNKVPIQANVICLHADATGFYAAQDAGSSGVTLYAFAPDGGLRWTAQLPEPLDNKGYMVLASGKLYYAGYTVDPVTGAFEETRLPLSSAPGAAVERVRVLGVCADGTLVYTGSSLNGTDMLVFGKDGEVRGSSVLSWLRGKFPARVTRIFTGTVYAPPLVFGSLYLTAWDSGTRQALLVKLSDPAQQPSPPPVPPAPVPVRLEVRPAEATVKVGESQQYRAFVIYSDGTERDVTEECVWSVSDPSIASVAQGQQGGLATGLKPGRVDVVAAWEVK